jgi:hypothetical protein
METVKFEDIKPGLKMFKAYSFGSVETYIVTSLPYIVENIGYFVNVKYPGFDCVVFTHISLGDANIKTPIDKKSHNDHQMFYNLTNAELYASDWHKYKDMLNFEEKSENECVDDAIAKVGAKFESNWGTFTNQAGLDMYIRLRDMSDAEMFNELKELIRDSFYKILNEMESKK